MNCSIFSSHKVVHILQFLDFYLLFNSFVQFLRKIFVALFLRDSLSLRNVEYSSTQQIFLSLFIHEGSLYTTQKDGKYTRIPPLQTY